MCGTESGGDSATGDVAGGLASARVVAGPATPSCSSPAHTWKRRTAASRVLAEVAVEGAGREASHGEAELQRRDVPALHAGLERPRSQAGATELAERPSGLGPDDPVDRDLRADLDRAHGVLGLRADQPVDRAVVDAVRAQRNLERGDARISRRSGRRGRESECEERRSDERS